MLVYGKIDYMDKRFSVFLVISALLLLVLTPGGFEALFAFIFMGMIPFTSYSLPPLVMLVAYLLLIGWAVYWLATQPVFTPENSKRGSLVREKARRRVSKKVSTRRYQQAAKAKA